MKKELSPSLEMVACDVCGRTILKGERTEAYLVPDGSRRLVCDLCVRRAEGAGWLRESLHGNLPATVPRAEPRGSLLGRLRRRLEPAPAQGAPGGGRHEDPVTRPPAPGFDDRASEPEPDYPEEDRVAEPPVAYVEEPATGDNGTGVDEGQVPSVVEPLDEPELADDDGSDHPSDPVISERDEVDAPPDALDGREQADSPAYAPPDPGLPLIDELPPADPPLEGPLLNEPQPEEFADQRDAAPDPRAERRERRQRRRLRDPRHVRAVPSGAEAKVERALEIFNLSAYRRTVGGLVRTLGHPWVAALPHEGSTSEVTVVVAWELSWYQFHIDLGDSDEPVTVAAKGHELDEIGAELQRWNATATDDGALEPGVPEP